MFNITDLGMQFGGRVLFEGVNLQFNRGNRYALVGANGAGKTTFLKLLAGKEEPTLGEVGIPKSADLGMLDQDLFKYDEERVVDIVLMGKMPLWKAMQEKEVLLETGDFEDEKVGLRLAECECTIAELDGYTAEVRGQSILAGLGIDQKYHFGPLCALSGGMKLRVLLAQALFQNPEILLLDEPTNHLDILSILWLENYLRYNYQGVLIMISHDQSFINKVATHILDIDYGDIQQYVGNYDRFEVGKALIAEQKKKELANKQDKINRLQDFVDRFGAKASKATQAKSKEKQIAKIELPDLTESSRRYPHFGFKINRPSGEIAVRVKGVSHAYEDKKVLNNVSFQAVRGEKIGIIGPNGVGKSTLLKAMMDQLVPNQGTITWGYEAQVGYFAQNHHEQLVDEMTALSWLLEQSIPNVSDQNARAALGAVLLSKDDVIKPLKFLSGGESARCLLARLMLLKPNVLLLDEPTNHLDIESVQALVKALQEYPGTLIIVSHNQFFLSQVVKKVLLIQPEGLYDLGEKWEQEVELYTQ